MRFTEKFCREQEGLQISRASSETLTNRRDIALAAAQAWDAAAILAHKQEPLDKLDAAITLEFAAEAAAGLDDEDDASEADERL